MFEDDACSLNTNSLNRMLDSATNAVDPESLRDPGECFDVRLPAGKAGVILDEGRDGNPVVHSVKPGSPLFNHIKTGDRLLSIDGVDCTGLSPHEIAKKLQANEHASSRILTFSRSVL
jgi:C-terminal processing protease CtpA/Prc